MKIFYLMLSLVLLGGCLSNPSKDSSNTGLQLDWTDSVKNIFSLFNAGSSANAGTNSGAKDSGNSGFSLSSLSQAQPCRLAEPVAGFNHTKKKDSNICSDEQRKLYEPFFGEYTGKLSGDQSGSISIVVTKHGAITGTGLNANGEYQVRGATGLVLTPSGNVLHVMGNTTAGLSFHGTITERDGLAGEWRNNQSQQKGQFALAKVAASAMQ